MADDGWKDYNTWDKEDTWNKELNQMDDDKQDDQWNRPPVPKSPWNQDELASNYGDQINDTGEYKNFLLRRMGFTFESMYEGEKEFFKKK